MVKESRLRITKRMQSDLQIKQENYIELTFITDLELKTWLKAHESKLIINKK